MACRFSSLLLLIPSLCLGQAFTPLRPYIFPAGSSIVNDSSLKYYLDPNNINSFSNTANWYDLSGNGNGGVFAAINQYTWQVNYAPLVWYNTASVGAYVTGNANGIATVTNLTFQFWANMTDASGASENILFECGGSTRNFQFGLVNGWGGHKGMEFYAPGSGVKDIDIPGGNWPTGLVNWAGVFTNGVLTCYTNGVVFATTNGLAALELTTAAQGSKIFYDNFGTYFKGYLGMLLIYNRALSSSEILKNYNATKATYAVPAVYTLPTAWMSHRWVYTDLVTNAAPVTNWLDRIANFDLWQTNSANRPTCYSTGVLFGASSYLSATNISINQTNTTMAFYYTHTGVVDYRGFISFGATFAGLHQSGYLLNDTWLGNGGTPTALTLYDWEMSFDGGTSGYSYNNGVQATSGSPTAIANIIDVGGNAVAHYANGVCLREIQFYTNQLGVVDLFNISRYCHGVYQ